MIHDYLLYDYYLEQLLEEKGRRIAPINHARMIVHNEPTMA
jgi:hypothetical protein